MDRAQATVGENLKVTLSFITQDNTDNSITYLVRFSILTYHTHQLSQVAKQGTLKKKSTEIIYEIEVDTQVFQVQYSMEKVSNYPFCIRFKGV